MDGVGGEEKMRAIMIFIGLIHVLLIVIIFLLSRTTSDYYLRGFTKGLHQGSVMTCEALVKHDVIPKDACDTLPGEVQI